MLIAECLCGSTDATPVAAYGLAMLQCQCGILRQAVDMTPGQYADWYRTKYHAGIYYHTAEWDRAVAQERLDAYAVPSGVRLLDVGAGNNAFVAEARSRGIDAWGQDLATQADGPFTYVGPLTDIAFPTDHFDVVTLHDVLEHVPDPRGLLGEVRRILKVDGTLIVDFPAFHSPSGEHHWKPVEHLWMLTEHQLEELLRSESFHVERADHPIVSKVVLTAANRRIDSPVRILVPAGIGDGYWVAVKLRGFLEERQIVLPEVWVHDAGPRRSEDFWRRVPFVRWGGYVTLPAKEPALRRAYTEPGYPVQRDVGGCDWFLSFNGALGAGRSLDEALPGPSEWDLPLWRPKAEATARERYRDRFGRYVVTAWWDRGFYQHWLAEFGEDAIAKTLRLLADAGLTVVLTGAGWDRDRITARLARADPRFVDLVGETSFDDLVGLVSGAGGVLGFPAGSTLLGPFLAVPSVLLWHDYFPPAMWINCVRPSAPDYVPLHVRDAQPEAVARALLDAVAGVPHVPRPPVPPAVRQARSFSGRSLGWAALSARQLGAGLLERRRRTSGAALAPGTLRLELGEVRDVLRVLGEPAWRTEPSARLGALCWWPVVARVGAAATEGWLVRHEQSRTPFLELLSPTSFAAARAGAPVVVALHGAPLPALAAPTPKPAPKPPPRPPLRRPPPRPAPRPPARPAAVLGASSADLVALARSRGVLRPDRALVLGGGVDVWADVRAAEALLGHGWDGLVVACNDVGCHWPGRLDYWATLHPEKFAKWQEQRRAAGHPDGYITWARQAGRGRGVDRVIQPWNGGGSSGLLAVAVAFHAGAEKLLLCGMPMNRTPHFAESKVHVKGRNWSSADSHWRAWTTGSNVDRMRGRVRSFGGRTRELLGAPDRAWLLSEEEEAA